MSDRGTTDGCVWCEDGTGDRWHRMCWMEAHDYFEAEEA